MWKFNVDKGGLLLFFGSYFWWVVLMGVVYLETIIFRWSATG